MIRLQGEEEAQLGLPKSPLCERSQHNELAKSQKGFIEFVVQVRHDQKIGLKNLDAVCVFSVLCNVASYVPNGRVGFKRAYCVSLLKRNEFNFWEERQGVFGKVERCK